MFSLTEPCPPPTAAQVNLGSLQQQLAALGAAGGERISPTLDAILELLEEAPADDAAAAADAFVEQVAKAAGAGDADAMPWAAVQEDAAEGGEEPQGEAEMEGVVGENAYAAAPDLADAPGVAGGRGRGQAGLGGAAAEADSLQEWLLVLQRHSMVALCHSKLHHPVAHTPSSAGCLGGQQAALAAAPDVSLSMWLQHSSLASPANPPDDYDDDGGFGGDDYYDADSQLEGEEQEGQAAAEGGEDGAVDQVG